MAVVYPFRHEWDRSRYSSTWLMTQPSEKVIQAHILQLLDLRNIAAFPVDAGAKAIRGRATGALQRAGLNDAARFVNFGSTGAAAKGVVDVVGVLPGGCALFVEVKRPEWLQLNAKKQFIKKRSPGLPTDDQLKFLTRMHSQGAVVGVCWAIEDLEAILKGIASERASPR